MFIFDGIGSALKSMPHVFKVAFLMGFAVMVLLYIFAPLIPKAFDIGDSWLVDFCVRAIRIIACAAIPMSFASLMNSYYLFQGHILLSILGTAFCNFLFMLIFAILFGFIWALTGFLVGLSTGIFAGLAALALIVLLRYGKKDFPLLLFDDDKVIRDFNFDLTPETIIEVRNKAEAFLVANNVSNKSIKLVKLIIEEIFMLVHDVNKGKHLMGECTLYINDKIGLVAWDDGLIFDITDTDQKIGNLRNYVVANLMQYIKEKKTITATDLNRNAFSFSFDK